MPIIRRVNDYTLGVREKVNHDWSLDQLYKVYTLREKNYSPIDIARMLGGGITETEVHNATRRMRHIIEGTCLCGNELTPEELEKNKGKLTKLCNRCVRRRLQYKRRLREDALAAGLCGYCHKHAVIPGKCACRRCLSATHRRRNLDGLCGKCGKNPIRKPGSALCVECAEAMRINKELSLHQQRSTT